MDDPTDRVIFGRTRCGPTRDEAERIAAQHPRRVRRTPRGILDPITGLQVALARLARGSASNAELDRLLGWAECTVLHATLLGLVIQGVATVSWPDPDGEPLWHMDPEAVEQYLGGAARAVSEALVGDDKKHLV